MSGHQNAGSASRQASLVCPRCRSAEYTVDKDRSERKVVFMHDRVCKECGTCYTPPTPIWARILFVGIGILAACAGVFMFIFNTGQGRRHILDFSALSPIVLACLSASCFWQAFKKSPPK